MKPAGRVRSCLFAAAGCVTSIVVVLTLGVVALRVTFKAHRQVAENMAPTIAKGDAVLVRPPRAIERGAVVVVAMLGGGKGIMRVVALPGETIQLRDGGAVVNGTALDEPYISLREGAEPQMWVVRDTSEFRVPPDHFFVLGDNRDHANDSRFIGPIKRADISGRVVLVVSRTDGIHRP